MGGQPGGARQDNRQRGNAAQLLEKYKSMARDAQLSGDRVQMEYYLQFADHYFRVLDENRSRFEDQRRQRGGDSDEDDGDDDGSDGSEDSRDEDRDPAPRAKRERAPRQDRGRRQARDEDAGRDDEDRSGSREGAEGGRNRTIALDSLPPAIGANDQDGADEPAAAKPKRRVRRPRDGDGETEIAPAA